MKQDVSRIFGYLAALVAVLLACGLTFLFGEYLSAPGFGLFMLAVLFVSVYGGLGPGLTAAGMSVLLNAYYFIPPVHSLRVAKTSDLLQLVFLIVLAVVVSRLSRAQRILWQSVVANRHDDAIDVLGCYLPICGRCKRVFRNPHWLTLHQIAHQFAGCSTFKTTCPDCEEHLPSR